MAPSPSRLSAGFPRLYAILDIDVAHARGISPADVLDVWLGAGVRLIQVRAKSLTFGTLLSTVEGMAGFCRDAGAALIVNDRADVARLAQVAGVHVGQEDLTAANVRQLLLPHQLVGVSTHDTAQVEFALAEDADYVAIGPVFPTSTKLRAGSSLGLKGVTAAAALVHATGKPLVAIGGITLESAPRVISAGADAVAVISDLLTGDCRGRAAAYLRALR